MRIMGESSMNFGDLNRRSDSVISYENFDYRWNGRGLCFIGGL
jgi:hypothetical protein